MSPPPAPGAKAPAPGQRDVFLQAARAVSDGTAMDVLLEVPVAWITSPVDGELHRRMFATLMRGLARRNLRLHLVELNGRRDFIPRAAPTDGFTLAYHSVGEVENVWRLKESPVPGYYLFDRGGYSGWADLARHPEAHAEALAAMDLAEAQALVGSLREDFEQRNISKYAQSDEAFQFDAPYVFYATQLRHDKVAKLYRLEALDVVTRLAEIAERRREHLIIKRHPLCQDDEMAQAIARVCAASHYVRQSQASVHRLIAGARSVVVANSGVGFEALIHGRPVYAFGGSEYQPVAHRVEVLDELEAAFAPSAACSDDERVRYIAYFLQRCCFQAGRLETLMPKIDLAIASARATAG